MSLLDTYLNTPPDGVDATKWEKPFRLVPIGTAQAGLEELGDGTLTALLMASRSADGALAFELHTPELASSPLSQRIGFGSVGVGILDWQSRLPTDPAVGQFHPPTFVVVSTTGQTDGGEVADPQRTASRSVLATVLIVLIFVTLTVYGMWVATSVAAEKSTRVMELLISAATPRELLVGKVVGVGGAGLTQYAAIVVPAALVVLFQDRLATLILGPAPLGGEAPLDGLTLPILGAFLLYFILGFILYALLYAAAGSLVSRQEDVQQLALPLSLISMASYILAVAGIASVGSSAMFVLSFVPFSSPFVMLSRIMVGRVEPWEIALSVTILAASSLFDPPPGIADLRDRRDPVRPAAGCPGFPARRALGGRVGPRRADQSPGSSGRRWIRVRIGTTPDDASASAPSSPIVGAASAPSVDVTSRHSRLRTPGR